MGTDPALASAFRGGPFVPAIESVDGYTLQAGPRYPGDQPARLAAWQALHTAAGARTGSLPLLSRTGLEAFESMESLQDVAGDYSPMVAYPAGNPLAAGLQTVAQLVDAGLGTTIAYVTIAGFDTHADRVSAMGFSEFGRRAGENGSAGTDHGKSGPMFLFGPAVNGGLHGEPPDLRNLDDGDLRYSVDFRSVYASVLEQWLGCESEPVLFGSFETLPLFKT